MQGGVGLGGLGPDLFIFSWRITALEGQPEDRSDPHYRPFNAEPREDLAKSPFELGAQFFELGVCCAGVGQESLESHCACSHGDRIAREGAGLIDRTEWCQLLHKVATTSVSTHWHSAADDLPVGREVGLDTVINSRSVGSEAKTGDDLVEDQQGAVVSALVAKETHEFRTLDEETGVGGDALDNDCCDLVSSILHQVQECLIVVEGQNSGVCGKALGHSGRRGCAKSRES